MYRVFSRYKFPFSNVELSFLEIKFHQPVFLPLLKSVRVLLKNSGIGLTRLEHFWDHGNLFEIWIVRATEVNHGVTTGTNVDNFSGLFNILNNNGMLNVLIRIASIRLFK